MFETAKIKVGNQYISIGQSYESVKVTIDKLGLTEQLREERDDISILMETDIIIVGILEDKVESVTVREDCIEEIYFGTGEEVIRSNAEGLREILMNKLGCEYTKISAIDGLKRQRSQYDILNYVECIHNILDKYEYVVEEYTDINNTYQYRDITIQKKNLFDIFIVQYVNRLIYNL